ncbi:hypothetical protein F5141DRAFT_1085716 [Pisolithus sp. B1]|nr:hypothetical protein F5141DRAFT_1085716 [Pisolithus sp. B1]
MLRLILNHPRLQCDAPTHPLVRPHTLVMDESTQHEAAPRPLRFRNSTIHEIPTPGTQSDKPPRYEPFIIRTWFVALAAACMIGLGITIEVTLHISSTQNGPFSPRQYTAPFQNTSLQDFMSPRRTFSSFFPTLLVVPLADTSAALLLTYCQPYVTLAEGNVPASRSILLDYVRVRIAVLFYSFKYKHYLVYVSTLVAFTVALLQPLAGSLLQVQQVPHTVVSTAISTRAIALSSDVTQLEAFLASAGDSGLGDPPYVHGAWTAASFEPEPGVPLNGSLAVNTTGLQTEVNCINTESLSLTSSGGNYIAQAAFLNTCSADFTFGIADGNQQYSVTNASSCALESQDNMTTTDDPQVSAIFCQPSMNVFTILTSMNLNNGTLGDCTALQNFTEPNNVTGDPPNGQVFNGVVFDAASNVYVAARAIAINSGLPGTVYRYASQQPGGIQSVFNDSYGWLNATSNIYVSLLAHSPRPSYLRSRVHALSHRTLPAHLLSSLMILIGITGLIVHALHARSRRKLWLTSPPGSIASIVSLTSRSGFGELLLPYDDESRMRSRLSGFKFRLDQRTGAIVAEEGSGFDASDKASLLGHEEVYRSSMLRADSLSGSSRYSFKTKDWP